MTIGELLERERESGRLCLTLRGMFFTAYGGSAQALGRIAGYKVKRTGCDYDGAPCCYAGFPAPALERVRGFIAECSEGYTRECWVLKCDLRGFFMSIGRMPLAGRLSELIGRKYDGGDKDTMLWLTRLIALHAPERDCVLRSDPR